MDKYLKMADVFKGELFIDCDNEEVIVDDLSLTVLESFSGVDAAKFALHAINSHDELVAEVERLRMSSELAIITLEEVDRVLTEKIKNGSYDLDDISGEVAYALERLSEHE